MPSARLKAYRNALLAAVLLLPSASMMLDAQPRPTLPPVTAYSLDKVKVTLPDDLAAQHNVLILYFEPDQSAAAVAWSVALQPIKYAHPDMQSYILPVYPRENFLYRWWIGASLRSNATPAQEWRSTIPIFVDKNKFLAALQITDEKQFVVLLTDKTGHVEWRTQGELNDSKMAALVAAVSPIAMPWSSHGSGLRAAGH